MGTETTAKKAIDERIYLIDQIATGNYKLAFKQLQEIFEMRQQMAKAILDAKFGEPLKQEYCDFIDHMNSTITNHLSLGNLRGK